MSNPLMCKHDSPSPKTPSYHYKRVCCDAPERSRAVLVSEAESQWSSLFLGICIGTLCVDDASLVSANDYERKTRSARSFFYTQSASTILFFSHLRVLYLPVCLHMHGYSKSALWRKASWSETHSLTSAIARPASSVASLFLAHVDQKPADAQHTPGPQTGKVMVACDHDHMTSGKVERICFDPFLSIHDLRYHAE